MEDFLEMQLPVEVIATLEFPRRAPRETADFHYRNFINTIQHQHRVQVGYISGYEHAKNIPLHIHSALIAPRLLDVGVVNAAWWLDIGRFLAPPSLDLNAVSPASLLEVGKRHETSVEVHVYKPGNGGLAYY